MIVAATGFFDGVHIGHRAVIEKACAIAREKGGRCLVVTFWPHPRTVLRKKPNDLRLITSLEEKRRICLSIGADDMVVLPFSPEFARLSAEEFFREYLAERLNVDCLVLGYDHRIGSDGISDPQKMDETLRSCGILPVRMNDSVQKSGITVSSSLIRTTLLKGDVVSAAKYLGYHYHLGGTVVHGNMIGRTIGFPTANMEPSEPMKLIPASGVYAVAATVDGVKYPGVCNIGVRPTIADGRGMTIETHIIGFDRDIYGKEIGIEFVERIRDEVKFSGLEELKTQLTKDRNYVANSPKVAYLCRNKNGLW